jgi:hypothetical protein
MTFFRQAIAPLLIVLVFLIALAATSARIFLPDGLSAPAPVGEVLPQESTVSEPTANATAKEPSSLSIWVEGIPARSL